MYQKSPLSAAYAVANPLQWPFGPHVAGWEINKNNSAAQELATSLTFLRHTPERPGGPGPPNM